MLNKISQIHITVDDYDRALAFYRDTLGLSVQMAFDDQQMAFLDCGGIRLYLGTSTDPSIRSVPMIYYSVDDIDQVTAQLQSRGVAFINMPHCVHRSETGELWIAAFNDSEGHVLHLTEERIL